MLRGLGFLAWPAAGQGQPAQDKMSRQEFRRLVTGRTMNQVLENVGKPHDTQDSEISVYWYYQNRTVDPVTGKTDWQVQVVFTNGCVSSVNF
jgi:hypothetical protein